MSICFLTPPRYLCCENFKVMISKCTLGVKSHSSPFMTTVSWLVRVPLVRNVIAFVPHLLWSCSKFLINSFFHIVYFILKVIQNERLIRIYLVFCHWLFHYLIMCEEKNLTVYNTVISSRYYFFQQRNTFQLVLITDDTLSFVVFNYLDINWIKSTQVYKRIKHLCWWFLKDNYYCQ